MRRAALSAIGLAGVLSACTEAEMSAAMEDPNGFACRERAVSVMSVPFEQTSATPINTNIFGFANYSVRAAGQTFRCTLDADGNITSFSRV